MSGTNPSRSNKPGRDLFLDHAAGILDTASSFLGNDKDAQDWTILVGSEGQLHMLTQEAAQDWPLESLAQERGARMAFRVKHGDGAVHVEGRQGLRSCSFATEPAGAAMQRLLSGPALYRLTA